MKTLKRTQNSPHDLNMDEPNEMEKSCDYP